LEPPQPLSAILKDDTAAVSQDFLTRTGTSVGKTVQVGTVNLRIAAVLKSEPDRLSSGIDLGPRILITRKALQQTGLIQFGSRASESFLYRLPERGLSLDQAREIINQGMPRAARIVDYRDPNPSLSRGLERTANYLSLIGLLAVLLSGLGVAMTIHSYLQQKLDHIAILKCLGGRSARIIRIYLIQGMMLGVAGSILGVGLGYGIQLLFPIYLQGLINLPTDLQFAPGAVVQGFLIGIITTLLFLLPPLLAIQGVRPARVFLREMPETRQSMLRRLSRDRISLVAALLLLVGIGLLASWLADSLRWEDWRDR
jgi:putative ABC transport system permease protein